MCLYPKLIQNPKYKPNKKNGGIIPPVYDTRVLHVPIGCGKCIECCKKKASEWRIRLLEDVKQNPNGKFITLTFSTESLQQLAAEVRNKEATGYYLDNEIATLAIRRFLERWRKQFKKSLRHWFITELGHQNTEHIHLHGIVWTDQTFETIREKWNYGYIWPKERFQKQNYVNSRTVNYIVKYVTKIDADHKYYKPIILTSPGIGRAYAQSATFKQHTYNATETNDTYRSPTGHKMALPIYYRNKAFTDQEREYLWLIRLDKNERWICGQKIRADDDYNYYTLLHYHRERNYRLGYGDNKHSWAREAYEQERRKIIHASRGISLSKQVVPQQYNWKQMHP